MNILTRWRDLLKSRDNCSQLTRRDITDEENAHALNVWEKGVCKTLGDYNLYLKTDVLLLADALKNLE